MLDSRHPEYYLWIRLPLIGSQLVTFRDIFVRSMNSKLVAPIGVHRFGLQHFGKCYSLLANDFLLLGQELDEQPTAMFRQLWPYHIGAPMGYRGDSPERDAQAQTRVAQPSVPT